MKTNNHILLAILAVVTLLTGLGLNRFAQASPPLDTDSTAPQWTIEALMTDFRAVEMVSATNGWAAGTQSRSHDAQFYHYDGSRWQLTQVVKDASIEDIDMVSATEGWAVGGRGSMGSIENSAIWYYDGNEWELFPSPTASELYGLDMTSAASGWAVGRNVILHYNGVAWEVVSSDVSGYDIDALSENDIWVVDGAKILHYDGTTWQEISDNGNMLAISMLSATDGWAVGIDGEIMRYNGTTWSQVASPTDKSLYDVVMRSANDGWAVGSSYNSKISNYESVILHYDGSSWQSVSSISSALRSIFMVSATTGWTVGDDSTIVQYDGSAWQTRPDLLTPGASVSEQLEAVDMLSATDSWAVGGYFGSDGVILDYDGNKWNRVASPTDKALYDIQMLSATSGWAVAGGYGSGSDEVIFYYDGSSWQSHTNLPDVSLYAVDMLSATSGWAVGYNSAFAQSGAAILHYDGNSWNNIANSTEQALYDVEMISASSGWAVGNNGVILSYNGSSWNNVASPTEQDLHAIDMVSATEGWAVGGESYNDRTSVILHYDGNSWQSVTSPTDQELHDVAMVSATEGWAVGIYGTLLYYDGNNWQSVTSPTGRDLKAITMLDSQTGRIVGESGIILNLTKVAGETYSISGRVTDSSGTGISDVTVSAGAGHTATTDSNGDYTISALANGDYTLTPSKSGYTFEPTSRSVSVQDANVTGQDFVGTAISENVELIGDIGGITEAVFVQGNYAYIGEGARLTILDITNPASPTVVGKTAFIPGVVEDVYVSGNEAYLAAGSAGLFVVDVSEPSSPTEVGFYDSPGFAQGVYVSGNEAYLADYGSGLRVVDVSEPSSPTEVGFYDSPGSAYGVYVSGNYAYLADYNEGLRVVDISTPTSPTEVGFYDSPGFAYAVYVSGDYAYLADSSAGLRVVDISTPSSPTEVGFYDSPGEGRGVYVSGNYAYLADYYGGLRVVDISSPTNPTEVGFYDSPGGARGVYLSGNYVYLADLEGGLRVVDISTPSSPTEVGFYDSPGFAYAVYVFGNYAYLADLHEGLRVVDISMPTNPTEVGFYDSPGSSQGVYLSGNEAYLVDGSSGLRVVDISSPTSPTEVGFYDSPGAALGVYVSGDYAYLADGGGGLLILQFTEGGSTYAISGRVTDSSGTGISDVTVSAGAGHTATTDSNGDYTISGLASGDYTLTPSKSGYTFEPTSRSVSVQDANVTGQDFVGTANGQGVGLQITSQSIKNEGPFYPGGSIGVSAQVENASDGNVAASVISYWVSSTNDGAPLDSGLIAENSVAALSAGESSEERFEDVYIPAGLAPGTYYVVFEAANTNRDVTEPDESNNTTSLPFTIEACANGTFCDVPETHTFHDEIVALYQNDLTNGCRSGVTPITYCPESMLERAHTAAFLLKRKYGPDYDPPKATTQIFVDVPLSHGWVNWINQLYEDDLTQGCSGSTPGVDLMYCPDYDTSGWDGYLKRADMATFLARLEGWDLSNPTTGVFADVTGDDYWERAVEYMWQQGYTNGMSQCENSSNEGSPLFCPNDYVHRGMAAGFMSRAFGYVSIETCASLTVNANPPEGGTITIDPSSPDCPTDSSKYKFDTNITLTANPNSGYTFGSWSGYASGSDSSTTITLGRQNRTVSANFTTTLPPSGSQLLANPSFEDANPSPWQWIGDCNYLAYDNSDIAQEGSRYVATNRKNNADCTSFYQDVTRRPVAGEQYTFGIWARSSDGTPRDSEVVIWARGGQEEKGNMFFTVDSTEWQYFSTSLTVEQNDHTSLRAEVYLHSLDEIDYYFDNAGLWGPPHYSISGRVTTSGGTPIAGVTVSDGNGRTATTNSNGSYTIFDFASGNHTLTPSKQGYTFEPTSRTVSVQDADVTGQDFVGTAQTASISGRVTDSNGNPISGVTLSAGGGRTATTNSNGNYTIADLVNGNYTLTPSKSGYTFSPTSRSVNLQGVDVTGQNFVGTVVPADTYSISGQVTDNNGTAMAGVTVSAGGAGTATTNSNDFYTITGLGLGNYTLVPSKSGYTFSPPFRSVAVQGVDVTGQDFVGTAIPQPGDLPPPPPSGQPFVKKVQACIGGPFYFKPRLGSPTNRYEASVDWQGLTPASVDFSLNGHTNTVSTNGNSAAYSYNLRNDFKYLVVGQRNTIQVRPNTSSGAMSNPYTLYAIGVDSPPWLPFTEMEHKIPAACTGQPMKVEWKIKVPEPPLEANVTPPDWFPFIGGEPFGLKRTQAGTEIEFAGDGEGSVKLFGQTGFDVGGQEVDGKLYGKGEGNIDERSGIHLDDVSFGIEVEGTIKAERPVVDIVCKAASGGTCPLKEAENTPIVGGAVKWFNEMALLQAKLKPAVDFALNFHSQPSGLEWKSGTGEGKVEITLGLIFEPMEDYLSAEGYGGGEPKLTFQAPANPSYLKEVAAELFAGVKLKVWRWEREFEAYHEWSHEPGLRVPERQNSVLMSTDWQPIPRTYATSAMEYAHFRANERPLRLGVPLTTRFMPTDEHLIASNVFPDGHPAIAADSSVLMLWVHDDVDKSIMQGTEINYSVYDGTAWSVPAGITSDNLQDFAPQVAFDRNGNAMAVWERNKTIQSETTEFDANYTNAFELAYAVWDGTSWSTPTYLTDNEALDHAPVLVRGGDGNLLLVWRQNAAGELLGTTSAPDSIYYAMWNGTAWTSPQVLLDNASGIIGVTAARHNANTQSVAYTRDTDDDLATADDQELFVVHWNGSSWGSPDQLTSDTQPDNSPTLFYDSNGAPRLLWLKGDTLTALVGSLSGTPQPIALEGSSTVLGYEATQDASGNLALVWQGYSDEGVDVFYATYDEAHDVFGLVQQLTHDESLEKFMAPVFAPTGEMVMAYNETALITETVTVSDTLQIDNVTKFGQTDLYVLTHTFGPDLTVSDITVTPANPAPGSTAQVNMTLHNTGDRAVENPEITLYLGNPTAGGTSIGASTANLTLAGGMTTTQPIEWNVPSNGDTFALYAVADSDNKVNELDETNNMGQIVGSAPDLVVERVSVGYGQSELITLTATISNTGVIAAPAFKVDFRLDDPITGTLIATANATSLAAGNNRDIQTTWDASSVAMGNYKVYAVIDPDEMIEEADETNNTDWAGLAVLPDLELRSTAVQAGTMADGSQVVSAWVFNTGSRDAENVTLGLYDHMPTASSTPLVSETISVPAGGYPVTTFNLTNALPGFYIGVSIGDPTADRNISNNVLLIGEPAHYLYLPTVLR